VDATRAARLIGPQALVVDVAYDHGIVEAVQRVRDVMERQVAALLVLPAGSSWLHGALPERYQPAVALGYADTENGALARALGDLDNSGAGRAQREIGGLSFDPDSRVLATHVASVQLTRSEATLLDAVASAAGGIVPAEAVAEALWKRPLADAHSRGAIRSHLHTLRAKLRELGAADLVESIPGAGYRLVPPATG
jgi:DNA-binding response OmpR family regulator